MFFLEICNVVMFYGSVTLRVSLQNKIMTYLHFSELNSLPSQYSLFYIFVSKVNVSNVYMQDMDNFAILIRDGVN